MSVNATPSKLLDLDFLKKHSIEWDAWGGLVMKNRGKPLGYEEKFANFIELCLRTKAPGAMGGGGENWLCEAQKWLGQGSQTGPAEPRSHGPASLPRSAAAGPAPTRPLRPGSHYRAVPARTPGGRRAPEFGRQGILSPYQVRRRQGALSPFRSAVDTCGRARRMSNPGPRPWTCPASWRASSSRCVRARCLSTSPHAEAAASVILPNVAVGPVEQFLVFVEFVLEQRFADGLLDFAFTG